MDQEYNHQFARQIFETLPQWIVADPRLRQDLIQALGTKVGLPPKFETFEANGRYQLMSLENGRFHSSVLPGFWLQVAWLWQSPLPSTLEVLQQLEII